MSVDPRQLPVNLLRDGKGIYGIGGAEDRCALLIRPDRLEGQTPRAALQQITGGFLRGPFIVTREDTFRQQIHHAMLRRAGLPGPPAGDLKFWSDDPLQQKRNRARYHGLRLASLATVNKLIREVLTVADPAALKQARRFRIKFRYDLYKYAAASLRALQVVEAFPALALVLATWYHDCPVEELKELVERGFALRQIAELARIPWALRAVKPGAALEALECCALDQRLIYTYLPDSLSRQKIWLQSVACATRIAPGYGEWVARHALEIGRPERIIDAIIDFGDWVRACVQGDQFIIRPFNQEMSLTTVRRHSHEWHEAVAEAEDSSGAAFPCAWYAAAKIGGIEIVPIETRAELYREGRAMHHCVASYAQRVLEGWAYVFSVREGGERRATIALERRELTASLPVLNQLRGRCNAPVDQPITHAVRKWLRSLSPLPPLPPYERPKADLPPYSDAVLAAHARGVEDRCMGLRKRQAPGEYLVADHAKELVAWMRGWDGDPLTRDLMREEKFIRAEAFGCFP